MIEEHYTLYIIVTLLLFLVAEYKAVTLDFVDYCRCSKYMIREFHRYLERVWVIYPLH